MKRLRSYASALALAGVLLGAAESAAQSGAPALEPPPASSGSSATADGAPAPTPDPGDPARDPVIEEAGQRFQRGLELYRDGDHALALIEFTRAYELIPNYRVLYNIGQVSIQVDRFARARQALEQYLAEGGAEVPEARRSEVMADIEMLKRRTAFISIVTNRPGAEILVDGVTVGESPLRGPLLVDAGEHQVGVRKAGFRSRPTQVILAGGDSATLTLELTQEEEKPTIVYERRVESKVIETSPSETRRAWLIAGWTTTGVLVSGAVVSGLLGRSAWADLRQELREETSRAELDDLQGRARTLLAVADGLTVGALAFGGMSLFMTLHNPKVTRAPSRVGSYSPLTRAQAKTTVSLGVGPRSVGVVGTF